MEVIRQIDRRKHCSEVSQTSKFRWLCRPDSGVFQYWEKEFSGFRNLFSRYLRAKAAVDWSKIMPLPENAIKPYELLTEGDQLTIKDRLNKLVVVKLNGGLGTSMGCKGPKSVIPVRNDLTFLDLTLQQIQVRLLFIPFRFLLSPTR